jgi:Tripartite tricarboxylate transporter family receptor
LALSSRRLDPLDVKVSGATWKGGFVNLTWPHVRAGSVKAYAVTAAKRLASAPKIPTVDEARACQAFTWSVWNALWVPKGAPREVIARLNAAAVEAMADATVRQRLNELGLEIAPGQQQTPEALGAFQRTEIEKWRPIIRSVHPTHRFGRNRSHGGHAAEPCGPTGDANDCTSKSRSQATRCWSGRPASRPSVVGFAEPVLGRREAPIRGLNPPYSVSGLTFRRSQLVDDSRPRSS